MNQQIETAIVSALETAQTSGDSTSYQTIIGNAVQQTLEADGIGVASTAADSASSTNSSSSTTSSAATSAADIEQVIQTLQQLFGNAGGNGSGQALGFLVNAQT